MRRRSNVGEIHIWPAFTDVLSSIVVVLLFLVTIFILNDLVMGSEVARRTALVTHLQELSGRLQGLLGDAERDRAALRGTVSTLERDLGSERSGQERLSADLEAARAAGAELEQRLAEREQSYLDLRLAKDDGDARAQEQAALLGAHITRLEGELERLNQTLATAQTRIGGLEGDLAGKAQLIASQQDRLVEMDRLIKKRLVERVEQLETYASDFFGRLRSVFADKQDIKVVGDRFVFQSEVLFPSGGADLAGDGAADLDKFVAVYKQLEASIPPDLPVIIEVQGHTDRIPIRNSRFRSNWELANARALTVVDYLISQGVPANRLAAVAMGEFHPIDAGEDPEALRRNRRIELKITSR